MQPHAKNEQHAWGEIQTLITKTADSQCIDDKHLTVHQQNHPVNKIINVAN